MIKYTLLTLSFVVLTAGLSSCGKSDSEKMHDQATALMDQANKLVS